MILFVLSLSRYSSAQQRIHTTFFEGTDYELNVYRIFGKEPGNTLLLIGGIQGDEPGGFLSADLYADFTLAKGNLIVVPRANFQSIVLNRRKINEDMNRKFDENPTQNYETKIVSILKQLISESDCMLNLHDGSGFFSETWENSQRNPMKYGQSLIADCEKHIHPKTGKILKLGVMARSVIHEMNQDITNPDHHFHFNNHRTNHKTSKHKEQRKSATYYAIFNCGIPAFGVETSKSLPLELKVRHHNLAINGFMKRLKVIPETPGVYLKRPVLRYLVLSINNSKPALIMNQQTLFLEPGDTLMVSHIEANYERGLSVDIAEYGSINDLRKKIRITKPTRITVRKDYYPCGTVYLALGRNRKELVNLAPSPNETKPSPGYLFYQVKINGEERIFHNYEHVKVVKGDTIKIMNVITGNSTPAEMTVNFKGYVNNQAGNTGEDRGYLIDTAKDILSRYSIEKNREVYQVVVTAHKKIIGKLYFNLDLPILKYVLLQTGKAYKQCFVPGETAHVNIRSQIRVIDIITNVQKNRGVTAYISGPGFKKHSLKLKESLIMQELLGVIQSGTMKQMRIDFQRAKFNLGSVFLNFFIGDAS